MQVIRLYALVYGSNWEDIEYFTDFDKARIKLIKQTLASKTLNFLPFIIVYTEDTTLGVCRRAKNRLAIQNVEILNSIGQDYEMAFGLIESVY